MWHFDMSRTASNLGYRATPTDWLSQGMSSGRLYKREATAMAPSLWNLQALRLDGTLVNELMRVGEVVVNRSAYDENQWKLDETHISGEASQL